MTTPDNLYDEVSWLLLPSRLSYTFTLILELAQDGRLKLEVPPAFEKKGLGRFLTKSMDLTEFNDGNGLSFEQIVEFLGHNKDAMEEAYKNGLFLEIDYKIFKGFSEGVALNEEKKQPDFFLSFHRSIRQGVACVYTILKDTKHKFITISFRGSVSGTTRDWSINLTPGTTGMKTPEKIKHKMPENLREKILIRKGFHEYLFANDKTEGKERYKQIREDIQKLLGHETGYSVLVTGHSLGGALASIFATWLAGGAAAEDKYKEDEVPIPIPKPITCVTWAAPFSGTDQFRIAHEHLEKEGLLRSVRITNYDDVVPTMPAASWMFFGSRMKHAGINIRLISSGTIIEHSSRSNWRTAIRNSMLKPVWRHFSQNAHSLSTHGNRLLSDREKLEGLKLDGLYKDDSIVSQDFIDGNF